MEELKKGLEISLHGEKVHKAVERVYQQIHDWGPVLPNIKPLVMDFGLGDFEYRA